MSPPVPANSNNPFLSDLSPEELNSGRSRSFKENQPRQQPSKQQHPTAAEEKEALRRKYLRIDNEDIPPPRRSSPRNPRHAELPPSYDEVAGSKSRSNGYPKEKSSSGERSRSHSDRERDREHRPKDRDREREREKERRARHRGESGTNGSSSHRHRKSSSGRKSSSPDKRDKSKGPLPKNVDTIDKLDVTGLFGGAFHHDGPFDACTPHRNKNTKAAPVMAFPADGPNSSIAGPTATKSVIKEVFGHDDVDDDYLYKPNGSTIINSSTTTVDAIKPNSNDVTQFDAKMKTELVHGPTTAGLGSTTFLDGAPAAPAAIKDAANKESSGIQRKKSFSQRLKVGTNKYDDVRLRKVSSDSTPNSPSMLEHSSFDNPRNDNYYYSGKDNGNDNDDYYVGTSSSGVRFDSNSGPKKESTSNKLLRRVKSLKVSRR